MNDMFLDINECNGNHGCQHGCVNTRGSYQCCSSGYKTSSDGQRCEGKYSSHRFTVELHGMEYHMNMIARVMTPCELVRVQSTSLS